MSMLDKMIEAVTPMESESDRAEARTKARAAATPGDWLSAALDHHLEIEGAFEDVAAASDETRKEALEDLALILTAHSIAEESALYPAMAHAGAKGDAEKAYAEQSTAKTEMAALAEMRPDSPDFRDKLEQIRQAVAHHVYEEEGSWFPALQQSCDAARRARLAEQYTEHFERYFGHALA